LTIPTWALADSLRPPSSVLGSRSSVWRSELGGSRRVEPFLPFDGTVATAGPPGRSATGCAPAFCVRLISSQARSRASSVAFVVYDPPEVDAYEGDERSVGLRGGGAAAEPLEEVERLVCTEERKADVSGVEAESESQVPVSEPARLCAVVVVGGEGEGRRCGFAEGAGAGAFMSMVPNSATEGTGGSVGARLGWAGVRLEERRGTGGATERATEEGEGATAEEDMDMEDEAEAEGAMGGATPAGTEASVGMDAIVAGIRSDEAMEGSPRGVSGGVSMLRGSRGGEVEDDAEGRRPAGPERSCVGAVLMTRGVTGGRAAPELAPFWCWDLPRPGGEGSLRIAGPVLARGGCGSGALGAGAARGGREVIERRESVLERLRVWPGTNCGAGAEGIGGGGWMTGMGETKLEAKVESERWLATDMTGGER
jgi:hypothetical protein